MSQIRSLYILLVLTLYVFLSVSVCTRCYHSKSSCPYASIACMSVLCFRTCVCMCVCVMPVARPRAEDGVVGRRRRLPPIRQRVCKSPFLPVCSCVSRSSPFLLCVFVSVVPIPAVRDCECVLSVGSSSVFVLC